MEADVTLRIRTIGEDELGRRLRRARRLAGLTQSQVAGSDVSAGYISRIESGQRRPDPELLERIAARLGMTVDSLLRDAEPGGMQLRPDLAVTLDHAELALASGDAGAALEQVDRLIGDRASAVDEAGLGPRASLVRAESLEALGRLNEAIVVLEDLTSIPAASSEWLRALIALSRCYRETGDFSRAIAVGERAAALIDDLGLRGGTEAIQLTVTVAAAYMLRGDLDVAMRLCMRAIEEAEAQHSPIARASAYWNASLIESRTGAHNAALDLARKALAAFELGEDGRNLARLRAQVAKMQLSVDPPDPAGALETLELARRELAWSASSTVDRASEHLTRARAELMLGALDQAEVAVAQARELLPSDAVVSRASAIALEGQIAIARNRVDEARDLFMQAVHALSGIGADREAAQLWFELGSLLSEVGATDAAMDAFRRAAASTGLTSHVRLPGVRAT